MNSDVTRYIEKLPDWQQQICRELRGLIHEADPEIAEKIKWGAPFFEDHGQVCGFFCARDWVHLAIANGALVEDTEGLFEETNNKAGRVIKIPKEGKILHNKIVHIVKQVVENNKAGKKVDLEIPKPGEQVFDIPGEYRAILEEQGVLPDFELRPYYQQKGYIQWIEEARREQTRERRIITMIEELHAGLYMPPKRG